jgi:thiamine pyrophosphate-dependent acetolactate synthase large subunit-like protein
MYPYPAQHIAKVLNEQGVKVAFGVHGGHIWQIVDALSNAGIKIITMRHEQSAVYAAEAYSKVVGKPGVAFATVGPGVANTVSAVQQAFLSCSPVVLLFGGVETVHDHTYAIQPGYAEDLFKNITKWVQRCVDPAQFKHYTTKAFKDSQIYPKGPIALEFPLNALWTPVPPTTLPGVLFGESPLYTERWRGDETPEPLTSAGDPQLVERAVKLLWEAEKPAIFAGDGTHWAKASEELREFVELTQIPVSTRRIARGIVSEDHPLYLDSRTARQALGESDLLISIGMKVSFFDDYGARWPRAIQINESAEHIWTYFPTDVAIVGNPKAVLRQMIDYIKGNNLKPPAGREEWCKSARSTQESGYQERLAKAEKYKDHKPVHFGYLSKVIWDTCEDLYGGRNRIIVDGYTISDYMPAFIHARYSGQVMDASEQAGIGHGIGMAIGAAFGDPETKNCPVIALMGDAGMGIAGFDVETALRFRLPIVYVVTENRGWMGSIRSQHYGKNLEALGPQDREYGEECLPDIRYDKLSEVFGCHGEHVDEPAQIRSAMERALKAAEGGKTAVVNVKMDPTVSNRQNYSVNFQLCLMHLPWDKIGKRTKALRRHWLRQFPWDEAGIPRMPMPDPWEPVSDEEAMP